MFAVREEGWWIKISKSISICRHFNTLQEGEGAEWMEIRIGKKCHDRRGRDGQEGRADTLVIAGTYLTSIRVGLEELFSRETKIVFWGKYKLDHTKQRKRSSLHCYDYQRERINLEENFISKLETHR